MSPSSSSSSFPDGAAAAVVVAGGSGSRLAPATGDTRKQYVEVAGVPVLLRALLPFLEHPAFGSVVVVLPPADVHSPPAWLADRGPTIVPGGAERSDSVWNGLQAVHPAAEVVLVHDGARPFVTREIIDGVLAESRTGGAVAAVRAVDTLKEADEDGLVLATADRARFWHAQTPQGFPRDLLVAAYERARREGWAATDDASLFERCGHPVRLVPGAPENIKVTHPLDLRIAEILARTTRGP